ILYNVVYLLAISFYIELGFYYYGRFLLFTLISYHFFSSLVQIPLNNPLDRLKRRRGPTLFMTSCHASAFKHPAWQLARVCYRAVLRTVCE
ncbi:MAG: hypothetical protein FWG92_04200, partial [Leptospirales bacterium]|nr:hypothetical protein [Leptospirales bacterium]